VITCPHCGAANKPESRFCGECGQPLGVPQGVTCPMCDTPNPPGVSVCTKCGAQLMPPGVSPTDVPLEAGESGEEVAGAKAEREVPTEPAGDLTGLEKTETGIGATEQVSGEVVPPWLKKLEGLPSEEISAELEEEERRGTGDLPEWLEVPPDFEEILAEASAAESEEEVAPGGRRRGDSSTRHRRGHRFAQGHQGHSGHRTCGSHSSTGCSAARCRTF
jgi:hypothetical protein